MMKKIAIKYGLISGFLICLIACIPFLFLSYDTVCEGYEKGELWGYTSMFLGALIVPLGIWEYQRKVNDGSKVSFKKGLTTGVWISVIAALMFVVWDLIFLGFVDPNFAEQYTACNVEWMKAQGASPEDIDKMIASTEWYSGAGGTVLMEVAMFITVFGIGFIVTLISALLFNVLGKEKESEVLDVE